MLIIFNYYFIYLFYFFITNVINIFIYIEKLYLVLYIFCVIKHYFIYFSVIQYIAIFSLFNMNDYKIIEEKINNINFTYLLFILCLYRI